jgi:D-psicose/D-tagatose/L-ribulose 3-epimerase
MRFGLNLLLWSDTLHDQLLPVLDEVKKIGYDALEIPIFEIDVEKYARWGKRLDDAGLARTGVTVRGPDDNPISPNPAIRKKGVEANQRVLDCCQAAGCTALVGPYHSAIGEFTGKGASPDEWKWGVESMRLVAEHAKKVGVMLGLECLNRFECYFLNTMADGVRFCRDVNHPNCRLMYDTFHSHIEEKSTPQAIRVAKDYIVHVHISENDRSTPGQGNVHWAETFDTLQEIGYDGLMVVEAFGLSLEKLVAATKIWRRMYQSEHQLATDALKFMKAEVAKRWK